ncbi:dual specificity protein phosphatase family protein [Ammoniphilus sp. 3BR4]|uniref:protein-tyrosine phosphatase family protein n=1 Tax=Ammoniphilus sp. 3BR4 TaxID=3158265 RepID=UPI0034666931
MPISEMIPGRLYAGGTIQDQDWAAMGQRNINAVVNLRVIPDIVPTQFTNRITLLWAPLSPLILPSIDWLLQLLHQIDHLYVSGNRVFVHCTLGVHRTGLVITAFYMYKFKMRREEALQMARNKRPELNPPSHYLALLKELESYLFR